MYFRTLIFSLCVLCAQLFGQPGGTEIRRISVGSLQSHITAFGSERAWNGSYYEGLRWPADYPLQDNSVIKRLWVAASDFSDSTGTHYDHYGIYFYEGDVGTTLFPVELSQTSKHLRPEVSVNGATASYSRFDIIDAIDPDQNPDRIIRNVVNTSMGLTQTREILVFSQEHHDNYFVKIFTYTNTGDTDWDSEVELTDSLRGVRIGWGTRYSCGREGVYGTIGSQAYGKHSWVTRRGEDYPSHYLEPITTQNPIAEWLRATFSWMGQSEMISWDNIGAPDLVGVGRLLSPHFAGTAVLHVDRSATDRSDAVQQPNTMGWQAGDTYPIHNGVSEQEYFDSMYDFLSGNPFPDQNYGGTNRFDDALESITHQLDPSTIHGDGGGTNIMITYGPYDLAHGESITIVEAEGISGLRREMCQQIGERWKTAYDTPGDAGPFQLPDGSSTSDKNVFKNSWVLTGKDSILKTFGRAKRNFDSEFNIVSAPLPPPIFNIVSDTAMIHLSWEPSPSEQEPRFSGYQIYRSMGSYDSSFQLIANLDPERTTFTDSCGDSRRSHFYYIQSLSDGSENAGNILNPVGPLRSSKFYTLSREGAFPLYLPSGVEALGISSFQIKQNYPNPFNPITHIEYSLGAKTDLSIGIYDVLGRRIKNIAIANQSEGQHEIIWDATNDFGELVPTGVYHFQIQSARASESIKMLYLK